MKIVTTLFITLFFVTVTRAQDTQVNSENTHLIAETEVVSHQDSALHVLHSVLLKEDTTCYSEISKVTFYEALLRQNNLDIDLKESANLALKNTEDMIRINKDRVSYSD
ncbi:hypothetical protein J8281_09750 [Aquimarina sp. U1-2]|uniref:hypothetical protein n=1 Tax=Aquimarina sp. U1-2 TaxID=2823141 RepID=UPI001AEC7EDC|nr:hypothetical protein [Aquimarina sp. U1-2]MBP2832466.1 hypothetical protein [Aquimarina sp. U1-2]